jgi:hypothetical protein
MHDGPCGTHWGEEKSVMDFGWKTGSKGTGLVGRIILKCIFKN